MTKEIFVFGSNLAGIHGAGSALEAYRNHGAIIGKGIGLHGNSYAIPTKDQKLKPLELAIINNYVAMFIAHAMALREFTFNVVEIGCGLAGYKPEQIGPMFKHAPNNVKLPASFEKYRNNL